MVRGRGETPSSDGLVDHLLQQASAWQQAPSSQQQDPSLQQAHSHVHASPHAPLAQQVQSSQQQQQQQSASQSQIGLMVRTGVGRARAEPAQKHRPTTERTNLFMEISSRRGQSHAGNVS